MFVAKYSRRNQSSFLSNLMQCRLQYIIVQLFILIRKVKLFETAASPNIREWCISHYLFAIELKQHTITYEQINWCQQRFVFQNSAKEIPDSIYPCINEAIYLWWPVGAACPWPAVTQIYKYKLRLMMHKTCWTFKRCNFVALPWTQVRNFCISKNNELCSRKYS